MELIKFERKLLDLAQRRIPLAHRPFAELAGSLGSDEVDVIARLTDMRQSGLLREIAGVFEASALGYDSALVACRINPDRLDAAGAVIAEHPGVSHCYSRRGPAGAPNLWSTVAVAPDSKLGLANTVDRLGHLAAADQTLLLPTLRRYKVNVHIGSDGRMQSQLTEPAPSFSPLTDLQRFAVQALQTDLPLVPEPFAAPASQVGLTADQLLAAANDLLDRRVMRRYGVMLRHRAAGLAANVLAVWETPPELADSLAPVIVRQDAVSHCYLRPPGPDWPFNLYTMIHGRTEQDCLAVVDRIAADTSLPRPALLWTAAEYKKTKVRYFTDDAARWERLHA